MAWGENTYHETEVPAPNSRFVAIAAGLHRSLAIRQLIGACCDTNGPDRGCIDDVPPESCRDADDRWTENVLCAEVSCECLPFCVNNACGDDGCEGMCPCDDGNACNGIESCNPQSGCVPGNPLHCNDDNVCNGVETCDPASGCLAGEPLQCNDGLACNGVETCNPQSGCVAGTPVNCDDGLDCTADACNEPTGTCTHDAADCAIPTVSEWGLVVVTLLLLTCAKVVFSRNRRSRLI